MSPPVTTNFLSFSGIQIRRSDCEQSLGESASDYLCLHGKLVDLLNL